VPRKGRRSIPSLLMDRHYGPFLFGKIISSSGVWTQNLAAAVLMYQLTSSAFMVGLVSSVQLFPTALLALHAGALTDRFDRRLVLLSGRIISGVAMSGLTVAILTRGIDGFGGPVVLLVAMGASGIGWAISAPSIQAIIPSIVDERDLEAAITANGAVPSIARSAGPALGAALIALGGPAAAFAVSAGSHLLFAFILLTLVRTRQTQKPKGTPHILGGVRYLMKDRATALLIAGVALVNFGAEPVLTLSPSIADDLGLGPESVGLLVSSFGVGAVLTTFLIRPIRTLVTLKTTSYVGYLIAALGLVFVSASSTLTGALLAFGLNGMGFMLGTIAVNTRIQTRTPDEVRGRVMAIWGLAALGLRPLAALMNGYVADNFSITAAILASAAIAVIAAQCTRIPRE